MRLNQIIAVLKTVKSNSDKAITELYHRIQKDKLFSGLSKTYQPKDDDGQVYPPELNNVVYKAPELLENFVSSVAEWYDLAYSQDMANTTAKADVVVDGVVILENVPITHLLFLEDRLAEVKAFVSKLPALPVDKDWSYSAAKGFYVTPPKESLKFKKITNFVVAYEATPEHPAQIREVSKDEAEGTWTTIEYHSGLPSDRVKVLAKRVDKLIAAVLQARQEANSQVVTEAKSAEKIFGYLFAD
ncbi:MAG: hypothetical protein ACK5X3_23475 [Pseudomonadota bacterium]|jgi:hypothetical protein